MPETEGTAIPASVGAGEPFTRDLPVPGSADDFALLFSPAPLRAPMRSLLALERVLTDLSTRPMDPEVRHAKLGWWAEEMQRLADGRAVHPAAAAAQATLQAHELAPAPLLLLFSAVAREALDELPDTPDGLWDHGAERGALVPLMAAMRLGHAPGPTTARAMKALGRARFLVDTFGTAHVCQTNDVPKTEAIRRSEDMLARMFARQHRELGDTLKAIDKAERPALLPLLVMAALLARALNHRASSRQPTDKMAGLARLWLAWRSARRASKGRLPEILEMETVSNE